MACQVENAEYYLETAHNVKLAERKYASWRGGGLVAVLVLLRTLSTWAVIATVFAVLW